MPPPVQSDEYDTLTSVVATLSSASGYVKSAYDFLCWAYGISSTKQLTDTLNKLVEELEFVKQRLVAIQNQLNELTEAVARIENEQRILALREHMVSVQTLAFKLRTEGNTPDDFAAIAYEAGLRADQLLDSGLWLWRDVTRPPEVRLLEPEFKTALALPVYSLALYTLAAAVVLHTRNNPAVRRATYGAVLDRHLEAISVRPGWKDGRDLTAAATLQEKVRVRIHCEVLAHERYSRDGRCRFDIYCVDRIERQRSLVREAEVVYAAGGDNVLCTFDPELTVADELECRDNEPAILLFELWKGILTNVRDRGAFQARAVQDQFPHWTSAQAEIYTVAPDGSLTLHRQLWPRIDGKFDQSAVVGSGWNNGIVVPGGGTVAYLGTEPGEWYWYRHSGAERPVITDAWLQRRPVLAGGRAARGTSWLHNHRVFGGGEGILYGIAKNAELFAINGRRVLGRRAGDLTWMKHDDTGGGSGGFGPERKVGHGWNMYRTVFSMGRGVIYGIDAAGFLFWYRHEGYLDGSTRWSGRRQVGNGWGEFAHVFAAGEGLIYAVYPNGRTFCYRHTSWRTGEAIWEGAVELESRFENWHAIFATLPGEAGFRPPN